ncbi:hypothetical protein TNCV_754921 [Trichonephila clavipes]|nr:hypothetical protein TNCV_754921 [Trichonephila clavipes]
MRGGSPLTLSKGVLPQNWGGAKLWCSRLQPTTIIPLAHCNDEFRFDYVRQFFFQKVLSFQDVFCYGAAPSNDHISS